MVEPSRNSALAALEAEEAENRERIAALADDLRQYDAAVASSTDDEHDPEGFTAYDRARTRAILDAALAHLAEIESARERLSAGTYGVCEKCGQAIAPARLEARPTARTCIGCA
ncbi:MAG: TraR/DksA family transcriptional regulator [Sporichthyaceae bacterium]